MMQIYNAGINELKIFHDGWYGLEKAPEGILYRASSSKAVLKFDGVQGRCKIVLLFSARPEHTGQDLFASVRGSGKSSFDFSVDTNHWCVREGTIELGDDGLAHIQVDNPWSPDKVYYNGDARSLGILLSSVRIEELPSTQSKSLWANLQEANQYSRRL